MRPSGADGEGEGEGEGMGWVECGGKGLYGISIKLKKHELNLCGDLYYESPQRLRGRLFAAETRSTADLLRVSNQRGQCEHVHFALFFFSRMRSEGFSFNSGGLGVESCSRPVASMFATVRNRSQPFATVRNLSQPFATVRNRSQPSATVRSRSLRRCHWGKLLQVTMHGCVTC